MKNITNYYWKVALEHFGLGLVIPISVLLPLSKGVSLAQVGIIESAVLIAILIFELPSGYFADKVGRKNSLTYSSLFFFVSFVGYALGNNFWVYLISAFIKGIALTLLSGAEEAYIFDWLKDKDKQDIYKQKYSKVGIFDEVATIFGLIGSSIVIYLGTMELVFAFAAVFMLITALLLWYGFLALACLKSLAFLITLLQRKTIKLAK